MHQIEQDIMDLMLFNPNLVHSNAMCDIKIGALIWLVVVEKVELRNYYV